MSRTARYMLIGAGLSLVAFTLLNYSDSRMRHAVPTTVNPADTHNASLGDILGNTAHAPMVYVIGAVGGLLAAKVF